MKILFNIILYVIIIISMSVFHLIGIIWTFKLNPNIGCDFKDYKANTQTYNDWWRETWLNTKNYINHE